MKIIKTQKNELINVSNIIKISIYNPTDFIGRFLYGSKITATDILGKEHIIFSYAPKKIMDKIFRHLTTWLYDEKHYLFEIKEEKYK